MNRRDFLLMTMFGCTIKNFPLMATEKVSFTKNPFSLGVASGDPRDDAIILWTRLVPDPTQANGGMPEKSYQVSWRVALDQKMTQVIRRGHYQTSPQFAHAVHVNVEQLLPNQHYYYQFSINGYHSIVGKTKTLASVNTTKTATFVTASCQNYTHGHFIAYQYIVEEQPDFVIFLGDYIYDKSFDKTVRQHIPDGIPKTLADYRLRHSLYKTDLYLQKAHANLPFFVVPDNHDALVDNNKKAYSQRNAAYQAWYENMPIRTEPIIGKPFEIHRKIVFGDLLTISLLDTRQYRDKQNLVTTAQDMNYGFGQYQVLSDDYFDEERHMLGQQQQAWLLKNIKENKTAWSVIASTGPFLPFQFYRHQQAHHYIGSWDGYPKAREHIVRTIKAKTKGDKINTIVLSGDLHSFWVSEGMAMATDEQKVPIVEFTTSSITADWPKEVDQPITDNLQHNPQVTLYEPKYRGYILHQVSANNWRAQLRALTSVTDKNAKIFTYAEHQLQM